MSKNKTSPEVQAYIQQRYEDTALVIYREQQASKQSNLSGKESAPQIQQAFENIAENREELRSLPGPSHHVPEHDVHRLTQNAQSQVCVII